ncbi:MAG: YciI family protein [Actinobacteria bacterium]|nr:YciI family protein [Actinomycetota bacterium]
MRYMMIMQVDPRTAPDPATIDMAEMFAIMGAYNDELQSAGVFLAAEGLADASEGFRVDFTSVPPVITDGPYAEAHEVFNGYWQIEVAGREEAAFWAKKCPLGPGAALEVRRIHDIADFAPDFTDTPAAEWLAKEQEWRAANG